VNGRRVTKTISREEYERLAVLQSIPPESRTGRQTPELFDARAAEASVLAWLGMYRHGDRVHARRDFDQETRWRRRWLLLDDEFKQQMAQEQFVAFCREEQASRQRACRNGESWDAAAFWEEIRRTTKK
jgi:hypothetical protein